MQLRFYAANDHGYTEGKPEAEVTSRVLVRVRSRLECAADERDLG